MKFLKIVLILIMLIGVCLSIINFCLYKEPEMIKVQRRKAYSGQYTFYPDGTYKGCEGNGDECIISIGE